MTDDDVTAEQLMELCEREGIKFRPWEAVPWEVHPDIPCPYPPSSHTAKAEWPQALRLRAELIKRIKAGALD